MVNQQQKKSHATTMQTDDLAAVDAGDAIILVVGDIAHWRAANADLRMEAPVMFADFDDIDANLITSLGPDTVLAPMMCEKFDCLDLAQLLEGLAYRGRFRVMSKPLPRPDIILAEVREICPTLDFDFIFTSDPVVRRLN